MLRLFKYAKRSTTQYRNRFFHTESYPILNRNNLTQGIIFKIKGNGENPTINKEVLCEEIHVKNLLPTKHYLIIHLLQTLRRDSTNSNVVASPHLAGGIFSNDLNIIPETGISKVHGNKYTKPSYIKENLTVDELITKQEYEANALFHSDKGVQASIFSPKDGGISSFGCARFIIFINIEATNISKDEYIKRIQAEKRADKIYNRQSNNCIHSLARVFTGNNSMDGYPLDTQVALVEIIKQISYSVDSIFSDNFNEEAYSSNLIHTHPQMRERIYKRGN